MVVHNTKEKHFKSLLPVPPLFALRWWFMRGGTYSRSTRSKSLQWGRAQMSAVGPSFSTLATRNTFCIIIIIPGCSTSSSSSTRCRHCEKPSSQGHQMQISPTLFPLGTQTAFSWENLEEEEALLRVDAELLLLLVKLLLLVSSVSWVLDHQSDKANSSVKCAARTVYGIRKWLFSSLQT